MTGGGAGMGQKTNKQIFEGMDTKQFFSNHFVTLPFNCHARIQNKKIIVSFFSFRITAEKKEHFNFTRMPLCSFTI